MSFDLIQDDERADGPKPEKGPYYVHYWQSERDERWRWHAKGWNHEIICVGSPVKSKRACLGQIHMIHNQLSHIEVEEVDDPNADD